MSMFLLMGESGECENRYEKILGLFERREIAEQAVNDWSQLSAREWEALKAFRADVERRAIAGGFPYIELVGANNPDMTAWRAHVDECRRLTAEMGGEPRHRYFPDRYSIVEMPVGEWVDIHPDYGATRPSTALAPESKP